MISLSSVLLLVALQSPDTAATKRALIEAERALARTGAVLEQLEPGAYAAAARRRRGELVGGDEGKALIGLADGTLTERGVVNPTAMTRMLAAGFGEG